MKESNLEYRISLIRNYAEILYKIRTYVEIFRAQNSLRKPIEAQFAFLLTLMPT
jgi:hypothetical protein